MNDELRAVVTLIFCGLLGVVAAMYILEDPFLQGVEDSTKYTQLPFSQSNNIEADAILSLDLEHMFNASDYDDFSGEDNYGTDYADSESNGFFGSCGEFNIGASNENITVRNEGEFDLDEWTIMMWVRVDSLATRTVISKSDGSAINFAITLMWISGEYNFEIRWTYSGGSALYIRTDDVNVQAGAWYHLAWTLDYTYAGDTNFYVNGTEEIDYDSVGLFNPDQNNAQVLLGSYYNYTQQFVGLIDEVRVFDDALSQATINQTYMNSPIRKSVLLTGLTASVDTGVMSFSNGSIYAQEVADADGEAVFDTYDLGDSFQQEFTVFHEELTHETPLLQLATGDEYAFEVNARIETWHIASLVIVLSIIFGLVIVIKS